MAGQLQGNLTFTPDGAFSLAAAANFGFGPNTGRPLPDQDSMSLAFVTDDFSHQAAAFITQDPDGTVHADVYGDADIDRVGTQIQRVLSIDRSGSAWSEVGRREPVIGRLQAELPGLRPVLFHSPYEAAAWSVLSQRRHRTQAAALRKRLSATHGRVFELPTGRVEAFPTPQDLLRLDSFPGFEPLRMERLHGVARAALDGRLDPEPLLAMQPEDAMAALQRLPGIGPMYAGLILLRSTGATDVMTLGEPRLPAYVRHFYQLSKAPSPSELASIADGWRPFRTWAAVLIRVAGDRDGVAWER